MMNTRINLTIALLLVICMSASAQIAYPKFGKGLQIQAPDSSFYMRIGFRFQTLFSNTWDSSFSNHESAFFIRRSRLKFDGWAVTPKLKYKAELALSNRDNGGGNSSRFNNAANIILDASVEWNFHKNLSIWVGQGKLPGNRERVVSSGNLQFVDRSRLNSRYNIDRDVGIMLKNYSNLGGDFILRQTIAISSGEGKNITSGNVGGYGYTFKLEALPFGNFASKGDYVGADLKKEPTPKLAVAVAFDTNQNAGRERGQGGSFISDGNENPFGKDLNTFFVDLMFKYQGLSIMAEYVNKQTGDGDPQVFNDEGENIATYFTGTGYNFQVGKLLSDTFEIAGRWTNIQPDEGVASAENQYSLGFSKYVVGHKLKVQTDFTYRVQDTSDDELMYRLQMDIHF